MVILRKEEVKKLVNELIKIETIDEKTKKQLIKHLPKRVRITLIAEKMKKYTK